jgi:hypothetical protein
MFENSEHHLITAAGWSYRTNSRGWMIYLNPQTRLWQTHSEAFSIIQAQVSKSENGVGESAPEDPGKQI